MKSSAASSNGSTTKRLLRGGGQGVEPASGAGHAAPAPAQGGPPATDAPVAGVRADAGAPVIEVPGAPPADPGLRVVPLLEQLPVPAPQVELGGVVAEPPFQHGRAYLAAKRALDLVAASTALLLLAPVYLAIALLIKLEDRGPVFFFQTRVGKGGRPFRFWKFRSMVVDAESRKAELKAQAAGEVVSDRLRFKMQDDPRVTRVGRVLRRFSLDELPQLYNVVRGDMTLVGPRPPIPEEVAEYTARHRRRLEVEQGITCLWQVSGRNLLSFEQQVELDIEYARRRDLVLDVSLLLRTIPAVLGGRGAC